MPRGFWDYGVNPAGQITAPQISASELAARLGSLQRYDRLGDLLFADGFEKGLGRWATASVPSGGSIALSVVGAGLGGYTCKLTPPATVAGYANIYTWAPVISQTKLGMEIYFVQTSLNTNLQIQFSQRTASGILVFGVSYRGQVNRLQYLASDDSWQTVPGIDAVSIGDSIPHVLKLVVDAASGQYVRVNLDDQRASLAGLRPPTDPGPGTPYLEIEIIALSWGGVASDVYIDNVIITHNEP